MTKDACPMVRGQGRRKFFYRRDAEDGGLRTDDGGQMPEVGGRKSGDGDQWSEVGGR